MCAFDASCCCCFFAISQFRCISNIVRCSNTMRPTYWHLHAYASRVFCVICMTLGNLIYYFCEWREKFSFLLHLVMCVFSIHLTWALVNDVVRNNWATTTHRHHHHRRLPFVHSVALTNEAFLGVPASTSEPSILLILGFRVYLCGFIEIYVLCMCVGANATETDSEMERNRKRSTPTAKCTNTI